MRTSFDRRVACISAVVLILISGLLSAAQAEVKLPAVFGDNMVIQRDMPIKVWGTAGAGEEVQVSLGERHAQAKADENGKWKAQLDALPAGGPLELKVQGKNAITLKNVLLGEVWVCSGQSNMEFSVAGAINAKDEISAASNDQIRLFTVGKAVADTPQSKLAGQWVVCSPETVGSFSAVGYFFGRQLRKDLKVPVGLIHSSWGGTPAESWTSRDALHGQASLQYLLPQWEGIVAKYATLKAEYDQKLPAWQKELDEAKDREAKARTDAEKGKDDEPKSPAGAELEGKPTTKPAPELSVKQVMAAKPHEPMNVIGNPWQPTGLYNAMIAPITQFPIRGAIWYQGESNAGRAYEYRTLMATMIQDWRKAWNEPEFPFLMVQLANFTPATSQPVESDWAELREAQYLTTKSLENVGVGTAIDIGDAANIHPTNKQEVGRRLALVAEATTYKMKDVEYEGPVYDSMAVEKDAIRLKFTHLGGGLVARADKPLIGFQIAGEDKKWAWADATIDGDTVIVKSAQVAKPVAVRYAWANNPPSTLYNKAGLPALPFRTDDWQAITFGKTRP
jgi:sialate O-acetylesterase